MTPAAPVSSRSASVGSQLRAKPSWVRLAAALGAGILTGLCFPPVGLGPVVEPGAHGTLRAALAHTFESRQRPLAA